MTDDLISRQAAIEAVGDVHPLDYNGQAILERIKTLPSAQQKGDIDEAVEYIKNAQEYLRDIGETWYADYLSYAIDLLVGERRE